MKKVMIFIIGIVICILMHTIYDLYTKYQAKTTKIYYAFGQPTKSSTNDYTTLGHNVFIRNKNNVYGVCIIRNNKLSCFDSSYNNSNWSFYTAGAALKSAFGSKSCMDDASNIICDDSAFSCIVYSDGRVSCYDSSSNNNCRVGSVDPMSCS